MPWTFRTCCTVYCLLYVWWRRYSSVTSKFSRIALIVDNKTLNMFLLKNSHRSALLATNSGDGASVKFIFSAPLLSPDSRVQDWAGCHSGSGDLLWEGEGRHQGVAGSGRVGDILQFQGDSLRPAPCGGSGLAWPSASEPLGWRGGKINCVHKPIDLVIYLD